MLTLQAATELLKKNNPPTYFTLILSNQINQHGIDAFRSVMLRNTSVTRICICAEQADTTLPILFLDAMLDIMCKNIHITDLVFKNCVLSEKYCEQIEEHLALNNRYASELKLMTKPRAVNLLLSEKNSEESFENKLIKVRAEISKQLSNGVKGIHLYVDEENITIASINQLVELRREFPQITKLFFIVSVNGHENYMQFALAFSKLTDGLLRLRFYINERENSTHAESQLTEKTWLCCLHALNFHSMLQELMLGHIDMPTANRITTVLSSNQNLRTLGVDVKEDDCLEMLSHGLRVNTTLRRLALGNIGGCKQGLMKAFLALQSHPILTTLEIGHVEFDEQLFDSLLVLLKCNSSIKRLEFISYSPLPTVYFIKLCTALENNTILQDLRVVPSQLTIECAQALNKLLSRNRTLRVLNFVSLFSSSIDSTTAAIKELFTHFPLNCHLIELNFKNVRFDDADFAEVLPDIYRVLGESKNLIKYTFDFDQSHSFSEENRIKIQAQVKALIDSNIGNRFENITIRPILELDVSNEGIFHKNVGKRIDKKMSFTFRAIQKVLTHLSSSDSEPDSREKQAIELFLTLTDSSHVWTSKDFRDPGPDRSDTNLDELYSRIPFTMANRYILRNELCKAYIILRVFCHIPAANTRLVEILFADNNYTHFNLTKSQWQQYLLIKLQFADLESDIAVGLTKRILRSLQTGKDENYTGSFVDLIGADRPLGTSFLINIAKSIVADCTAANFVAPPNFNRALIEQLQEALDACSLTYIQLFNLLRTHPLVKKALFNKYGAVSVVCFDELILNKGQPISSNAPSEWTQAYQAFLLAKQQSLADNSGELFTKDSADLVAIKEKFDEYYDIIFLTEKTRLEAHNSAEFRQQLIDLSKHFPSISAFLGALFAQLEDIPSACKYFTQAAEQGDFSEIKVLRKAAKEGKPWAIELLSQPLFTIQYPQMWLFLGNCYARHGKWDQALACYQKTGAMTSEALVLIGNCHVKLGDDTKAIACYREADPFINQDACTALELLADKKQHVYLVIILADIYRRKMINATDDINILTNALRYNFKASQEGNVDAKSFLTTIASNPAILKHFYAIALQLEDNPDEMELAKQLYSIAQETHPVARLELMRLDRPPIMTIKEKIFDEQPQFYSKCLAAYFYEFNAINIVGRRMIIYSDNRDVAMNICQYLNANLTLSPKEILTWLREKAINNKQRISGELARMFCCAIVQLKKWSGMTVEHKPEVTPLPPPRAQ